MSTYDLAMLQGRARFIQGQIAWHHYLLRSGGDPWLIAKLLRDQQIALHRHISIFEMKE